MHGNSHRTGAQAPSGDQKTSRHSQATRKTSMGSHHHPHMRAVLQHLGHQPILDIPRTGPTTQPCHQDLHAIPLSTSVHPQQILYLGLSPGISILGTCSQARQPRLTTHGTGCSSGARASTIGSSSPQLWGWGSQGQPGIALHTPLPHELTPQDQPHIWHTHNPQLAGCQAGPHRTLP